MKITKSESAVDIKTLNGYFNYGNRLQVFALSKIVSELNRKVYIFWPKTKIEEIKDFLKSVFPLRLRYAKEAKLYWFTKKHIPKNVSVNQSISIYGSDQVWNPEYLRTRPYLLFDNEKNLKVSYAASLGVSAMTDEQSKLFKDKLKNLNAISVREQSAKKLLEPLTDKEIEVVLDPTLLLNASEYTKLEKRPKSLSKNEKYILCYILGDREYENTIRQFAEEKKYKIILFSDKRDSNYGIEEFLYLIHHAQLVCTDSFHACVFSLIFERPFVAFRRTGRFDYMYGRLQNLINTFRLENREYNGKSITEENLKVNFSEAKKILEIEREKSINYIKRALRGKYEK